MSYNYYEFNASVKIIGGKEALSKLPELLHSLGVDKVMLISGPVLNKIGVVDMVKTVCDAGGVNIKAIFVEVPNDSSLDVVKNIASVFNVNGCDAILAVGGGSVLDTAKGVKMVLTQEATDLSGLMGVNMTPQGKRIPFVALPTTSGTGSEVTAVSVITDTATDTKLEFMTQEVLPDACILDPVFTQTLPPKATLLSAFDTLSHAIEAYTCTQRNPIADAMAKLAIGRFKASLSAVIDAPNDLDARYAMMEISTLAGLAFSSSMVGGVHAIGHSLGAVYKLGHDLTMSLLLPRVMEYNKDIIDNLYSELLYYFSGEDVYKQTPKAERCQRLIDDIRAFYRQLAAKVGAVTCLSQLDIDKSKFDEVARKALRDGAHLLNYKELTTAAVLEILEDIYVDNSPKVLAESATQGVATAVEIPTAADTNVADKAPKIATDSPKVDTENTTQVVATAVELSTVADVNNLDKQPKIGTKSPKDDSDTATKENA